MKRIFIFLFALAVAVSTLGGAQFTDVSAAEVIEISNVADLICIADRPDADYRLASDIDMEALDDLDGFEWESIPSFSGNFYGDGHSITVIDEPLFGTIESGATVQDLGVLGKNISGAGAVGILAGEVKGAVERCHATGSAEGERIVGGLAGLVSGGEISDCYASVDIHATEGTMGGFAGKAENAKISCCYAIPDFWGDSDPDAKIGSFLGENSYSELKSCYYTNYIKSYPGVDSGSELGVEDLGTGIYLKDRCKGFDFENTWNMVDGLTKPRLISINGSGTESDPYRIHNVEELAELMLAGCGEENAGRYFMLDCDLRLRNNTTGMFGSENSRFTGIFDGNNHVIRGLLRSLFGVVDTCGVVKNVTVQDCFVFDYTGDAAAQGFIAERNYGAIENCHVYDSEFSSGVAEKNEGGIVGENMSGTIRSCSVENIDISVYKYGGGIAGCNIGGTISDCAVNGCVIIGVDAYTKIGEGLYVISLINGKSDLGGIAGYSEDGLIESCRAQDAEVNSMNGLSGGLVGRLSGGNVMDCRLSDIFVRGSDLSGGLIGINLGGAVSNCYADGGEVRSPTAADRFVGNSDDAGILENCSINNVSVHISNEEFADISGHWAEATIRNLVEKGVVNGYEDGTFRPEDNATKGEFIKLLMTAAEEGTSGAFTNYPDVNESWAKGYIARAIDLGICDNINTSEESFGVDEPITRAQAAALMGRLLAPDVTGTPEFTDSADIPDWAADPIYASAQLGLIEGDDDGAFRPTVNLTRAEAATIILRVMSYIG